MLELQVRYVKNKETVCFLVSSEKIENFILLPFELDYIKLLNIWITDTNVRTEEVQNEQDILNKNKLVDFNTLLNRSDVQFLPYYSRKYTQSFYKLLSRRGYKPDKPVLLCLVPYGVTDWKFLEHEFNIVAVSSRLQVPLSRVVEDFIKRKTSPYEEEVSTPVDKQQEETSVKLCLECRTKYNLIGDTSIEYCQCGGRVIDYSLIQMMGEI